MSPEDNRRTLALNGSIWLSTANVWMQPTLMSFQISQDFKAYHALLNTVPIYCTFERHIMVMSLVKRCALTPVNGDLPPGLLFVELVDQRLNDHIAKSYEVPLCRFEGDSGSSGTASSKISPTITVTATPSSTLVLPIEQRAIVKRKGLCFRNHDGIASRLPARSRATMHRLGRTCIGRRLQPRAANPATRQRLHPCTRTSPWLWGKEEQTSRQIAANNHATLSLFLALQNVANEGDWWSSFRFRMSLRLREDFGHCEISAGWGLRRWKCGQSRQ